MIRSKLSILTVLIGLSLCGVVLASLWHLIARGRGYRIQFRDLELDQPLTAVSQWSIRMQHGPMLLAWESTPFQHTDDPSILTDTSVSIVAHPTQGPIQITSLNGIDYTDVQRDDDTANVAIGLQGTGKVDIDMRVEMLAPEAPAGTYCSTVFLTITAP